MWVSTERSYRLIQTPFESAKKSSCVNARGILTAAYQVLHMLSYPGGLGTLARGVGT